MAAVIPFRAVVAAASTHPVVEDIEDYSALPNATGKSSLPFIFMTLWEPTRSRAFETCLGSLAAPRLVNRESKVHTDLPTVYDCLRLPSYKPHAAHVASHAAIVAELTAPRSGCTCGPRRAAAPGCKLPPLQLDTEPLLNSAQSGHCSLCVHCYSCIKGSI
jgi:hypothetical protein